MLKNLLNGKNIPIVLLFLIAVFNPVFADWDWAIKPPTVHFTTPITSDNVYVTDEATLDIAGSIDYISRISGAHWLRFSETESGTWEETDFGWVTLENNWSFATTWYANDIPLPEGNHRITVVAYATHGSGHAHLEVVRSTALLEELWNEELAQVDPSASCGQQVGDPIDTATGAQFLTETLLIVQGVIPIAFTLEYNSLLTKEGMIGRAWDSQDINTHLEELANGDIKIHWTTNRYNIFSPKEDGYYVSSHSACHVDELVKTADNQFTLTRKNGTVYQFDTQGQLIQKGNQQGQFLSYDYNSAGRLARITEPVSGVFLDYAYNSEGLLETVTDPLGRQVLLAYDASHRLIKITNAAEQTTTYTYNRFGQIVTAVNADGEQLFSNIFDDQHRIVSQDDGIENNQLLRLTYDNQTTTVTNRVGDTQIYTFDENNRLLSLTDELGYSETYTYDANGKRTRATSAKGQTTYFSYDTQGNLKTLTDAANRVTQLTYDANGNLLSVENALGKRFNFSYENNLLTSVTNPLNQVTRYSYNEQGQILSKTSPLQAVTKYAYAQGRLAQVTNPEGITYVLDYDAAGRLIALTDSAGNTTTLTYDDLNRLIKITNPLGHEVSITYDSRNNPLTFTDAKGQITHRSYDGNGNLIKQINALGQETRYEYDGEDRLVQVIDALGRITTLNYDAAGRLIQVTNPLGHTHKLEYDAAYNLLKGIDALGNAIISFTYDALDNPLTAKNALGQSGLFEYDALNRLVKSVDPLNRTTQFNYDALNRLVSSVDALSGESSQGFDADGQINRLTDANGHETQFAFDKSGRLVQETVATQDKVNYTYNARDLLTEVTNGRGQKRQFVYDAAGRLTRWTDPEGTTSYSYDNNGNILTVTDAQGTITREYDALNRMTKYTDARGNTLQYTYDVVGNLIALTYPDDKQVHYEYDVADQLVKVTDWAGRITQYQYDANGRLVKTIRSNGTQQIRAYDVAGQLLRQTDSVMASGEIIKQFDFAYDAVGNIVEERTSSEIEPEINLEMTYQAANRLATFDDKIVQFDADGNLLTAPLNGQMSALQFDSRNRLVQAGNATYRYDAENQRIGMNQTQFVVNSQPALSQVLVKESSGIKTFYVYGLGLIGEETNGRYRSYHFDYRGSTVALTNEIGQVIQRFQYAPYSELVSGDAAQTPFLFNGMYGVMTDDNGLYYMRARFYSPEIKRFVNQDVLMGFSTQSQTLNRYTYVIGQPINYIDPFGLSGLDVYDGFVSGFIGFAGGMAITAVALATLPISAPAMVALALTGSAVGGFLVGVNGYEYFSGRDYWSDRRLTTSEKDNRLGHLWFDVFSFGFGGTWFRIRTHDPKAVSDWEWLKFSPSKREAYENGLRTVSDELYKNIAHLPPEERKIATGYIRSVIDSIKAIRNAGSGPTPKLRLSWPFGVAGSQVCDDIVP